jgi:TPP-dependent pyruvate/acetoin dehydrogenase alpha subunit
MAPESSYKTIPRDQLLWMYERMMLIREFEETLRQQISRGVPTGPVHYYIGQEAVAVGVCAALRATDWIASTHRGHGHAIAKGADVRRMMAELYGKSTGTNHGKGGSMHITDTSVGMLGVNPIVGMGVTHAVGAALSAKVRGTAQVAATFFGDGATSQGAVHEAMNLAAIWRLPVLFVCENNGYADATPVEYAVSATNIADRAAAYNMPGTIEDGQDVVAVFLTANTAAEQARAGNGPTLIECKTYRYYGHHQSDDPLRYRTAEEEAQARTRDCIKLFRKESIGHGIFQEEELDAIGVRCHQLLGEAVTFARESPVPEDSELYNNVYAAANP